MAQARQEQERQQHRQGQVPPEQQDKVQARAQAERSASPFGDRTGGTIGSAL